MDRPCRTFGCEGRLSDHVPERFLHCSQCQRIFGNTNLAGLACRFTTPDCTDRPGIVNLQGLFDLLQERNQMDLAKWLIKKLGAGELELDRPVNRYPLTISRTNNPIPLQVVIDPIWLRHGSLADKIISFRQMVEGLELVPVPLLNQNLGLNNQLLGHAIQSGKLPAVVVGEGRRRRYYLKPTEAVKVYEHILIRQALTPAHHKKLWAFPRTTPITSRRGAEGPTNMEGLREWMPSQQWVSVHITARCLGIDPRRIVRAIINGHLPGRRTQPRGTRFRYYQNPEMVQATIARYQTKITRQTTTG